MTSTTLSEYKATPANSFFNNFLVSLDQLRIKLHLKKVLNELRNSDTDHLTRSEIERRSFHLQSLEEYIHTSVFPINNQKSFLTPIFRDSFGTLCAMGYVMHKAGEDELVNIVARKDNFVRIKEITYGSVLHWINNSGLTQTEAARVQPNYSYTPSPEDAAWVYPLVKTVFWLLFTILTLTTLACMRVLLSGLNRHHQKAWGSLVILSTPILLLLSLMFVDEIYLTAFLGLEYFDMFSLLTPTVYAIVIALLTTGLMQTRKNQWLKNSKIKKYVWTCILLIIIISASYQFSDFIANNVETGLEYEYGTPWGL